MKFKHSTSIALLVVGIIFLNSCGYARNTYNRSTAESKAKQRSEESAKLKELENIPKSELTIDEYRDLVAYRFRVQHNMEWDEARARADRVADTASSCLKPTYKTHYEEPSGPVDAPAFDRGLFVYVDRCFRIFLGTQFPVLTYSSTPPDAEVDVIEEEYTLVRPNHYIDKPKIASKGRKISRDRVDIAPFREVCNPTDYVLVNGHKFFCEPYGYRLRGDIDTLNSRCTSGDFSACASQINNMFESADQLYVKSTKQRSLLFP